MKALKIERVEVSNLAEVAWLMNYAHAKVIDVGIKTSWPYGIEELCVTLEGEGLEHNHHSYVRFGGCKADQLPLALDAVKALVWRKEETGGRL